MGSTVQANSVVKMSVCSGAQLHMCARSAGLTQCTSQTCKHCVTTNCCSFRALLVSCSQCRRRTPTSMLEPMYSIQARDFRVSLMVHFMLNDFLLVFISLHKILKQPKRNIEGFCRKRYSRTSYRWVRIPKLYVTMYQY